MEKMRVLYVLDEFLQIAQTYMKSELQGLQDNYDIRVIARTAAHNPYQGPSQRPTTWRPSRR